MIEKIIEVDISGLSPCSAIGKISMTAPAGKGYKIKLIDIVKNPRNHSYFLMRESDLISIQNFVDKFYNGVVYENYDFENDGNLSKREKQHSAILAIIKQLGFDPMAIPDGEKGTIESICRAKYDLLFDGDTSFESAWRKGKELFKMANHASYAKRGD